MGVIATWLAVAVICLLLFAVGMLMGIVRHSLKIVLISVALVFFAVGSGLMAVYQFAKKSYRGLNATFRARTGYEAYSAVFGKPSVNCVQVMGFFDPLVPIMDAEQSLCFKTCPPEVSRILGGFTYTVVKEATPLTGAASGQCCRSFNAAEFGDSVLAFKIVQGRDYQMLYISADSTRGYYIEMW